MGLSLINVSNSGGFFNIKVGDGGGMSAVAHTGGGGGYTLGPSFTLDPVSFYDTGSFYYNNDTNVSWNGAVDVGTRHLIGSPLAFTCTSGNTVGADYVQIHSSIPSSAWNVQTPETWDPQIIPTLLAFWGSNGLLGTDPANPYDGSGAMFQATWADSSTSIMYVGVYVDVVTQDRGYINMASVDTSTNTWLTPGLDIYSDIQSAAGTYTFPATFALVTPTVADGHDWC